MANGPYAPKKGLKKHPLPGSFVGFWANGLPQIVRHLFFWQLKLLLVVFLHQE
jgi:hypothetical protein